MRVPISWIKKYTSLEGVPIELIAEKLSMAGFEVEEVIDMSRNANGVVVGLVETVEKHPNAQKLSICKVGVGKEKPLQIVCGAPNVRPGQHVPVALVGAELNKIGLTIKDNEIRGVSSSGMICSLSELGLENSSEGIAVLNDITTNKKLEVGSDVNRLLGLDDQILDIAITANRPDGMSIIGIAKEISALINKNTIEEDDNYKFDLVRRHESKGNDEKFGNTVLYSLTLIENVNNNVLLPEEIKDRLNKCGINVVNPIVDITNYIMLQDGQPLHAFDIDELEKVTGEEVTKESFSVCYAKTNEKFIGLDNKCIMLNEDILIVKCNKITVGIAGVMGSLIGSVKKSTRRVFIESAVFPQQLIRNSSRTLGVRTESSSRF